MEYLRSSVNLRAYGQRDPLVEYKKEGLKLFQTMEETYAAHIGSMLPNIAPAAASPRESRAVETAARAITARDSGTVKKEYGRNDRVVITDGKERREMKYKKAEAFLTGGGWRIVEN